MKPLQSLAGHIHLNEPLPWDVLDGRGQSLLRKGYVLRDPHQLAALIERGVFVDQDEFDRYRRETPPLKPVEEFDPFWRWEAVLHRLSLTLREHVTDLGFVSHTAQLADEIDQLTERDTDAGIFAMFRLDMSLYPIAHSLRTAFVGGLVARGLGLSKAERLLLLKAALTMNIAMIELQKVLYKQSEPLTEAQQAEVKTHPTRGWQRLEAFGVRDEEWLLIVAQHHETSDGKGYPIGLTSLSPLAEVIQQVDLYCAMTSGRLYRKALPPNQVARQLFLAASSENPIPMLLIKKLGIYPPGSFVKLVNGEIGVVVRCGESAKSPKVFSLSDRKGVTYIEPVRRDTRIAEFAVVDAVCAETVMFQLNPRRLFGYGT